MKPRILLSYKSKKDNYVNAVNNSGGIADAQYCPGIGSDYDGLILCGGGDIHPGYFGEEINGSTYIDEERDAAEFELVKHFVAQNKPILGICRGHQVLNVAFGGNMFQDIPNAKEHSSADGIDLVHKINVTKNCFLYDIYGPEFSVNSHHHQAVKLSGDGIEFSGFASGDSTVEALQHKSLPVFGVQWHPERMCLQHRRQDTVDGAGVFKFFIEICTKAN